MKTNTTLVWYVVIALIVGGFVGYYLAPRSSMDTGAGNSMANQPPPSPAVNSASAMKELGLFTGMRKLWADHVFWTREYMIAAVDGAPSATAAANRLMKNQEDIGNAVAAYYGAAAGSQLTTLLKQHISIAVDLVAAAKANDPVKFKDADQRWQANANQIAVFLSKANPNWPESAMADAMAMHLQTTATELTAILGKQYDQSVTAFDAVFDHMMDMSDILSAGIVKQFPNKFE